MVTETIMITAFFLTDFWERSWKKINSISNKDTGSNMALFFEPSPNKKDKKNIIDLDNNKDLVDVIISLNSNMYRFVTKETLSFLVWLRRFADGLIEGED